MRRLPPFAALLAALSIAATGHAQVTAGNSGSAYASTSAFSSGPADARPIDPGRASDRDPLTGRGGGTDTARTFSATIGRTIGTEIGSTLPSGTTIARPR